MAGSRPQSHGDAISMGNSLEFSTTLVRLPTATKTGKTAATTAATTTNNSTVATLLHK